MRIEWIVYIFYMFFGGDGSGLPLDESWKHLLVNGIVTLLSVSINPWKATTEQKCNRKKMLVPEKV